MPYLPLHPNGEYPPMEQYLPLMNYYGTTIEAVAPHNVQNQHPAVIADVSDDNRDDQVIHLSTTGVGMGRK